MKFIGKISIVISLLFVFSCGEKGALKEETIYFKEENKAWLSADVVGDNFVLSDTNQIEQGFCMKRNLHEFSKSWGGFLGITTDMTHSEYHYQSYTSNFGTSFSISLSAGFPPFGDEIYINLNGIGFAYDIKHQIVSRIDSDFGIKSNIMTDEGYEQDGEMIYSTVKILDFYSTSYKSYNDVLCFEFLDYQDSWESFTVTKIYVAKNTGLIKYEMNNGAAFERKE